MSRLFDVAADFIFAFLTKSGGAPAEPDALPTFRVYGPNGLVGSGTAAQLDAGAITNVSATNPAVVTSNAHGLTAGMVVSIAGVVGITGGINGGPFAVTPVAANTFSVPVNAGGAYVSGGAWHATGLHKIAFTGSLRSALAPGQTYTVVVTYAVAAAPKTDEYTFTAV